MANNYPGLGRGGRGFGLSLNKEPRPGLPESVGRGSLARGSGLLFGAERQNVLLGRGSILKKLEASTSSVVKEKDVTLSDSLPEDHSDLGTSSSAGLSAPAEPRNKTDSGLPSSDLTKGGILDARIVKKPSSGVFESKFGALSLGRGSSGATMLPLGRGIGRISTKAPQVGSTSGIVQAKLLIRDDLSQHSSVSAPSTTASICTPYTGAQSSIGSADHLFRSKSSAPRDISRVSTPSVSVAESLPLGSVSSGRGLSLRRRPVELPGGSSRSVEGSVASAEQSVLEPVERSVTEYHGTAGTVIPTRVNCVRVKCGHTVLYQYHVAFTPDIDNKHLRFSLLNQHRDVIGHKAFDGTVMYLPKDIGREMVLVSERITDGAQIKLKIRMTARLNPTSSKLIPFYNVVMHKVMKTLKLCQVGRNYYDPTCPQPVPKYNLDLWPGYVTAIREMEGGLYLNIDCSFKVLRKDTVLTQMHEYYRTNRGDFRDKCLKEMLGTTVLTRYNNNNYRVDDIDFSLSPMSTFTTSKGETISFYDYYSKNYKIQIKDTKQPMLVSRPKRSTQRATREQQGEERAIYLVPELCFLTGISDKLASDFSAMKDIGEITRMSPINRDLHVRDFLKRVNASAEARAELGNWGLELDASCAPVESRVLPSEKVMVGGGKIFHCNEQVDFFRDISRAPMLRSIPIRNWIIVFTNRDQTKARDFTAKLSEVSRAIGMQVGPPEFAEIKDDRSETFNKAISSAMNKDLQLVVCIFPTLRDDRYSAVKRLCCVEMPVPSQVIISKTLPRDSKMGKFRSVTMKIALQINCKLGGELWALSIPLDGLMVCGIDVYHEGKGGNGKSVAAFVASMNKLSTRWHSRAVLQQPHQEIVDGLKHCFCDALVKYYETNHKLPERVIIYRDGVGDGQLNVVAGHEVEQLKSAMKMFDERAGGKYAPKFTVVVVSKRINVRYFRDGGNSLVNPPPGTVLDHTATRPNWPDFYLVSQHVRQGTVSPTHYLVVHGAENMKPDHLQRLTYKLTHMYYNWPGTVRVPAPCQYAHKLAYLVGENIRKEPSQDLCDRLFYL